MRRRRFREADWHDFDSRAYLTSGCRIWSDRSMDIDELVELEHKGWQALSGENGAEFYDAFLADEAMMVLPFGVMDRDECVEAIAAAPPWMSYELSDIRVVVLSDESAMVVYNARAQREGLPEYRAVMSTTYVRRDREWLIACHQQTPLIASA